MTIFHNVYMKCEPYMTFQEIMCLHEAVKALPKKAKILECGVWKGGSTLNIGTACLGKESKITVVDVWDVGDVVYNAWLENVTMGGIDHMLEVKRGDSVEVLKELAKERPLYYDFCLLDTDHEYERTDQELTLVFEMVKSNGWIFMHDIGDEEPYLYPGCTKVWYGRAQHLLKNHKKVNALYGGQKP